MGEVVKITFQNKHPLIALMLIVLILSVGCSPESTWIVVDSFGQSTIDYQHYPSADTVTRHLQSLPTRFPQLVRHEFVGESVQGKPISALSITNYELGEAQGKPALFVMAQQHAREPIGSQLVLSWVDYLLDSFGKDEVITHLLNTRTVYVIPQVNPDGNDIFLTDDHRLRSNLRPSDLDLDGTTDEDLREGLGIYSYDRQLIYLKLGWAAAGHPFRQGWDQAQDGNMVNANYFRSLGWVDNDGKAIKQVDDDGDGKASEDYYHGVDINRNWDIAWLEGDARVTSYTYKGTEPWSEPETRALRDFVLARPNIVSALDVHSGVNMILYPWSITVERPVDEGILQELARAGSAIAGAPHTMSGDGLYLGYGTSKDWLYSQGILAITAEVYGATNVASYQRIWPSQAYIVHTSLAHRFNPAPQDISQNNEKWQPYLTYLLAVLPGFTVSEVVAQDAQSIIVTIANTGHLTPSLVRAHARDEEIKLLITEPQVYTLELPLAHGETVDLSLELGSLLKVAERPLPEVNFCLTRSNDSIEVEDGDIYSGPSPATLFAFGYVAPIDPWGQAQWFITKSDNP